jgi:hypothetical protein
MLPRVVSATPPSIVIAAPVLGGPVTVCTRCVEQQQQLGGPEVVRVVLNSSSSRTYVHGPRVRFDVVLVARAECYTQITAEVHRHFASASMVATRLRARP